MMDDTSAGNRFESLGIPRSHATSDSILGKRRTWEDLEKWEVAFLVIAPLSMLVMFGFTVYKATTAKGDDLTFAIVLIISIVFCFLYVIDGVLGERPYEITIFLLGGVIVLVYIICNYAIEVSKRDTVKLVRLVLICILGPVNLFFGVLAAREYFTSRRLIFRTVGADDHLQNACGRRYFFIALLKFDLHVALSILVLILHGRTMDTSEIVILSVGVPLTLVWSILGYLSVRFENKVATIVFLATFWLIPGYVGYKVTKTIMDFSNPKTPVLTVGVVSILFAVAAIVVRLMIVITGVRVLREYEIGLKEKMYPTDSAEKLEEARQPAYATFEGNN